MPQIAYIIYLDLLSGFMNPFVLLKLFDYFYRSGTGFVVALMRLVDGIHVH